LKKLFNKTSIADLNKNIATHSTDTTDSVTKKYFVIPYIRNISEIITSIINKSLFTIGYRGLNKLDRIIKVHKDQTEHQHKNNVIYKIYCKNCNASYVGQTKRQLKTRIREHYNNIKLDDSRHSVVTQRMVKHNHAFDWKNVRILDSESNYNKTIDL